MLWFKKRKTTAEKTTDATKQKICRKSTQLLVEPPLTAEELDLQVYVQKIRYIGLEFRHLHKQKNYSIQQIYEENQTKLNYVKDIHKIYSQKTDFGTRRAQELHNALLHNIELILTAFKSCEEKPDLICLD